MRYDGPQWNRCPRRLGSPDRRETMSANATSATDQGISRSPRLSKPPQHEQHEQGTDRRLF